MEDLKILKIKRKENTRRIRELKRKLKEEQKELNDVNDQIAEIEGVPDEVNDIRSDAENFTRNIKKRPRPSYEESFNEEQEGHTGKRQKRNEKMIKYWKRFELNYKRRMIEKHKENERSRLEVSDKEITEE